MLLQCATVASLLTLVNAACAEVGGSGLCRTCTPGTFGARCDRFSRETADTLQWSEFGICVTCFTLVVLAFQHFTFHVHVSLAHTPLQQSSGQCVESEAHSGSAAPTKQGDGRESALESNGEPHCQSSQVSDPSQGPAVVKVSEPAPSPASQPSTNEEAGPDARAKTSESQAPVDTGKRKVPKLPPPPKRIPPTSRSSEPQTSRSSTAGADEQVERTQVSRHEQRGVYSVGSNGPSRQHATSDTLRLRLQRSPNRSSAGAGAQSCPSTALPEANITAGSTSRGASRSPRQGSRAAGGGVGLANKAQSIPIVAPPPLTTSARGPSTRQLPPTINPVALDSQGDASCHTDAAQHHSRAFSSATDLHYPRSSSAAPAFSTPLPLMSRYDHNTEIAPPMGRSASAMNHRRSFPQHSPHDDGRASSSLITLDCPRPALVRIDEADGSNHLRFDVRFQEARSEQLGNPSDRLPVERAWPRDEAAFTQDTKDRHPPQAQHNSSVAVDARRFTQPSPAPDALARLPKFRKGDVIRRNAQFQEHECDFGGFVGSVMCGEVVCVHSITEHTVEGRSFFTYEVVGGDRAPPFDMERLFTRVEGDMVESS